MTSKHPVVIVAVLLPKLTSSILLLLLLFIPAVKMNVPPLVAEVSHPCLSEYKSITC